MEASAVSKENFTESTELNKSKEHCMSVSVSTELCPMQWRQLQIEPICQNVTKLENILGKLIYKRVLRKSLALMVANDIQYQHIIEHNDIKALCEITNYIFTKSYLDKPLDSSLFSNLRSMILIITQKQLRKETQPRSCVEKALFVSKQMLPKWKVKCFKFEENSTVKSLLDKMDTLMKGNIVFDLQFSIDDIGVEKSKQVIIWAKCISHKSINCQGSKGLYASEYPKISTICE